MTPVARPGAASGFRAPAQAGGPAVATSDPTSQTDQRNWSLAARLTAWYALSSFVLVGCATILLYVALVHSVENDSDRFLADRVQDLRLTLAEHPPGKANQDLADQLEEDASPKRRTRIFFRVIDDGIGRVVSESPEAATFAPRQVFPEAPATFNRPSPSMQYHTPDGQPMQLLSVRIAPAHKDEIYVVQAAMDMGFQSALLHTYRRRLWLTLTIAGLACLGVGYTIAVRGIHPVNEIAQTAQRIRSTTLDERIDTRGMPAELASLGSQFNDMLDRLRDSFERLSRFSADIAHELRTPVNNLRGMAEVALFSDRSAEEYREVLASCLEEYQRLTRIIESLLYLARAEDPQYQISREPLDLAHELELVKEFYEPSAGEAGVDIQIRAPDKLLGQMNRTLLQRAVGNLVANAIQHTPPGGSVTLAAQPSNGSIRIDVIDTGCGISPEHLPRVFDRLYRVAPDRNKATGGAGLGLAIVKSITTSHGGHVDITSVVGRGTRVSLVFPAN